MTIVHELSPRVHSDAFDGVEPFLSPEDVDLEVDGWAYQSLEAEPDAPGLPTLPMADWIAVKASEIRLFHDSDLGRWLADRIDALAEECRHLAATTPAEFDARSEVMAATTPDRIGYLEGYSGQPYPAWDRSTSSEDHFARVHGWTRGWYDRERDVR